MNGEQTIYLAAVGSWKHQAEAASHGPAVWNDRPECGRGLSAPTESNVIDQDSRGTEAPPTFKAGVLRLFIAPMCVRIGGPSFS